MKWKVEIIILETVYVLMLFVIFILPHFSVADYSTIRNTTSQLGAQFAPNGWIMNITFVSLGIGSVLAGWKYMKGYMFQRMFLLIFGISLTLTAIFHHAPIDTELQYIISEDGWHSYFAFATGLSFTIFAISTAAILRKQTDKKLAVAIGIFATLLSILMSEVELLMGIWQRLNFIISFGWMIYTFGFTEPENL